jgi:HK97 family phage portal protein
MSIPTEPNHEARAAETAQSSPGFLEMLGLAGHVSVTGEPVTVASALGIPAFGGGVRFLASTLAGLPVHVYRKRGKDAQRVSSPIARILRDAPNPSMSSFDWRKYSFEQTLTGGRHFSYIERNGANQVTNIFPLDPSKVTVSADGFRRVYKHGGQTYRDHEIIDVPYMLKGDMLGHYGPVSLYRDALSMSIEATAFGAKAFQSGGIPPTVLQGPFSSGAAAKRASDDISSAMQELARAQKNVLAMPEGHRLEQLGYEPEKMQLLELQRFCVEEIARILALPPVFLQDLSRATFTNSEQQDLHLVKHTVSHWAEQFEQELNLKLFPRGSDQYVKMNVDGLLRGDIKTRMEAHSAAIQNGIYSPGYAAEKENAPQMDGHDQLFIQGGTMPIVAQAGEGSNGE